MTEDLACLLRRDEMRNRFANCELPVHTLYYTYFFLAKINVAIISLLAFELKNFFMISLNLYKILLL